MSTPGHNNPPPIVAHSLHIEDLFTLASGSTASPVTNDDQETALDSLLDEIRKARKDADDQRAVEKRPHDMAAMEVQRAWKPLLDRCDAATSAIKTALTPYRTAKQSAKDKAAREAREEAEARAKAAQEALREADDLEARFAAEVDLKQASKLTAVANKIDRSATGLRTFWDAEITDRKLALYHYIARQPEAFEALIQHLADTDARGARPPVPGVIFHQRKVAA